VLDRSKCEFDGRRQGLLGLALDVDRTFFPFVQHITISLAQLPGAFVFYLSSTDFPFIVGVLVDTRVACIICIFPA
jgi:hypothetical protein